MRWWDYVALFSAVVASVGLSGLVAGWAAERRLDRIQRREYARPSMNDQLAEELGEATDG